MGAALTLGAMFVLNPSFAAVTVAIVAVLYAYISLRQDLDVNNAKGWADISQALAFDPNPNPNPNPYPNPDPNPNQARIEGNELFKAGNYSAAIEQYTDAMKHDPTSALPYSNRAACYQKLMEWQVS